ncbi:MAG: hypothetical protein EAZ06_03620 [Cytophagales bacterium]|nr:MAG: hypothetical protein EAZ06_03620 [Cytophagales bacterium]
MGTLKIERPNQYLSLGRKFEILLDGEVIGKVENGETKEFSIPEGKHSIKAKVEFFGSSDLPIEIDELKTKNIKLSNNIYISFVMVLANFLMLSDIILFRFLDIKLNLFIFSLAPILIILCFILSINNHLVIEDLDKK